MRVLVQHVDVVGIDEIASDQDVPGDGATIIEVAAGGRITAAEGDEVVDGSGSYLAPGYIDVHFHGSDHYPWTGGRTM